MKDLPSLPYDAWRDTRDTLHRWMQVVGKIRLVLTPVINHWWNVPLYVSAHGLTTSSIPYGEGRFEMEFDFVEHVLRIRPDNGPLRFVDLRPRTVADFYRTTLDALKAAGIDCSIRTAPCEILDHPIPLDLDKEHRAYEREYAHRFWRILAGVDAVLTKFRAGFIGKCSPVQFFWGSFDLAVTRFSGRRAPAFPANSIEREAYSHEVSSVGWWPGDQRYERAAFYSYAAPEPPGFARAPMATPHAYYHPTLKGFYLDYDHLRAAADPEATLLGFCEETYAAAADLGNWPRLELERQPEERHDVYPFREHRQPSGEDEGLRGMPPAR